MKSRLGWLLLAGALVLGTTPLLYADVTPAPSSHHPQGHPRLRERVEQLRARVAALSSSAAPSSTPAASVAPPPSAVPSFGHADELSRKWAALAATRPARRERHRAELMRAVGTRWSDPQAYAELKLHAKRVAELGRLEFLAQNARQGADRDQLLARIAKLSAREAERHRQRLARLAAAPAPSTATSAPIPASSGEAPR
jgi:hypothetical protein